MSPAISLGFTIFYEIFVYVTGFFFNSTIEVASFHLQLWYPIMHRCLLDVYLEQREQEGSSEEDKKEGEKEKESKEEGEPGKVSPMTTKILSLVSYLLSQPGIKSAILQLISAG